MTVYVDAASNMAVERPAGSHALAAAGQRGRSAHIDEKVRLWSSAAGEVIYGDRS